MTRTLDVLFDEHVGVAERLARLALGRLEGLVELAGRMDDTHALSTTAVDGLDEDGVACEFEACQRKFI